MNWITENLPTALIVIGLLALVTEIMVLGFSTFVLFFVGLGAVLSGILIAVGVIPDTPVSAMTSVAVLTGLSAALLWQQLQKLQNHVEQKKVTSDLVGHSFVLTDDVSATSNPSYNYSGIEWKLISNEAISAGCWVEVVQTDVGKFYIRRKR